MADIHILVADDSAGRRLDAFLGANDGCPTRSACAHLIEGGAVAVNGETGLRTKSTPCAPAIAFRSICPSRTIPPT